MKPKIASLYLSLLNVHYGWSLHKHNYLKKRQRIWEPILLSAVLIPAAAAFAYFLWAVTDALFVAGLGLGQPHLALVFAALIASVLMLLFGFLYVLSAFYFSTDLPILLTLPLKPWEILVTKLAVVLTGQYLLNGLILLPVWLKYGLLAGVGASYVAVSCLVFLILPILPLVIASIAAVILMRFTNLSRYKDRLTLISGLLFTGLWLAFQFWLQNNTGGDTEAFLIRVLSETDGLVKVVGRVFPTSIWASQAMAYSFTLQGWLNLSYLVMASAVGLGILYFVGNKVFLSSVLSGFESGKQRRRKAYLPQAQSRSKFVTMAIMEIKLFIRDPNFALNGLIGYVMLPVLVVLPQLSKNLGASPFDGLALQDPPAFLLAGGIALFFLVMTAFSSIAATTFSREGKNLWIIRSLPLTIGEIVVARMVAAQVINTLGCLVGIVPLAVLFRWSFAPVSGGIFLGILLSLPAALNLIFLDLRRPMLDWVNPIKAVKSNLNVMLGIFGSMLIAFALGMLMFWNWKQDLLWLIPLELLLITAISAVISCYLFTKVAPSLWQGIEGGI